jgi:multiple sugar transport system substrate-binding protein
MPDLIALDQKRLSSLEPEVFFEPLNSYLENQELTMELMLENTESPRWAIPLVSFMYLLYYNTDVLSKAGFDRPPKTREEFLACARTLSKGAYGMALSPDNPHSEGLGAWTWTGGLKFLNENQDGMNVQVLGDTLNFMQLLAKEGLLSSSNLEKNENELFDEFIAGRIGMMTASIAGAGYIREHAPELGFSFTAVPPPASYSGKPPFVLRNWGAGIVKQSDHKDEAWLFIAFLAEAETNARLAAAVSGIPANSNARGTIHSPGGHYEKALAMLEAGDAVNELAVPVQGQVLEKTLRETARAVIEGKTPEECIKELEGL